jgi:integrase
VTGEGRDSRFQARSISSTSNARRIVAACRREPQKPVSREEFNALLRAAEKDPSGSDLKDILTILFHTGIRTGELCELRWKDVDFQKRHMLVFSKGNSKRRRVPFGKKVLQVLETRRRRQLDSEFVLGPSPHSVLDRASRQLRLLSPEVSKDAIGLRLLRAAFMLRWANAGGSFAQLACITGCRSLLRDMKTEFSFDASYKAAAKFQAQLEEEAWESRPRS